MFEFRFLFNEGEMRLWKLEIGNDVDGYCGCDFVLDGLDLLLD
jgi:hypothetical protein